MRAVGIVVVSALLLSACGKTEAPAPTPAQPAPAEPAPPPAEPAASTPDTRIGAIEMTCGGETFRVAFEATRAVVVGPDGSNMDLPLLGDQPGASAPTSSLGVKTYTNGVMTFTRETAADSASVVRFARGRMAFQECVLAQT